MTPVVLEYSAGESAETLTLSRNDGAEQVLRGFLGYDTKRMMETIWREQIWRLLDRIIFVAAVLCC